MKTYTRKKRTNTVGKGEPFWSTLTGVEKANLVLTCLKKLSDVGLKVRSLTCDGPSTHFAMLGTLGAVLNPEQKRPFLPPSM